MFEFIPFVLVHKNDQLERIPLNNAKDVNFRELGIKDKFWVGQINRDWQVIYAATGSVISKGSSDRFEAYNKAYKALAAVKDKWENIKAANKQKIKNDDPELYNDLFP